MIILPNIDWYSVFCQLKGGTDICFHEKLLQTTWSMAMNLIHLNKDMDLVL